MATLTKPPPTPDLMWIADTLAALGSLERLQILHWLGEGERNVTELQRLGGKSQAAVSHHLSILRLRELVALDRRGKCNYYAVTDAGRAALAAAALIASD